MLRTNVPLSTTLCCALLSHSVNLPALPYFSTWHIFLLCPNIPINTSVFCSISSHSNYPSDVPTSQSIYIIDVSYIPKKHISLIFPTFPIKRIFCYELLSQLSHLSALLYLPNRLIALFTIPPHSTQLSTVPYIPTQHNSLSSSTFPLNTSL
jgi:hypothetical protein